ncbi:DapA-like [Phaffia rhodozyma]|uniref:DapA-like n=1 Tax=Phaffia rhodozyma TaxID=264483 RepID=A0A0F7SKJ2_PHARH|nr:DapA-like [Phaffia rhodozyma]
MVRTLSSGCYAPIPTFFDANEELDVDTFSRHIVYLAKLGMYPVVAGSMGEAHHLTPSERKTLIIAARKALDDAELVDVPIIAGTGVGSTRGTIELSRECAEAGADCAIVIASGYYAGALNKEALIKFFVDVADASPIPVMIYNYPGASGGIDLDSDTILEIANRSSNICGVKLTCGAVGKLTRITGGVSNMAFKTKNGEFLTLGGFADFILPTVLGAQAQGAIMGLGNLYPRAIVKLFKLSESLLSLSKSDEKWLSILEQALELQTVVSTADAIYGPAGIAATKATLQLRRGYGGNTRLPLLPCPKDKLDAIEANEGIKKANFVEKSLSESK